MKTSPLSLTPWQKKQAAMLYYYSSVEYLEILQNFLNRFIDGTIEPLLDLAKIQNRDELLESKQWGDRNTSQNWSNYAWPFLKDLQLALTKNISLRKSGVYEMINVNQYFRGVEEYSLEWATLGEKKEIEIALRAISEYAENYDYTVADETHHGWDDYLFAYSYPSYRAQNNKIPRFRIVTDKFYVSSQIPLQAGVYIAKDDPNASLQFCWPAKDGAIRKAVTFNQLGDDALSKIGRDDLWFNIDKMFDFSTSKPYIELFKEEVFLFGIKEKDLAPSAVARESFMKRDCEWYFLELILDEFDDIDELKDPNVNSLQPRMFGGEKCNISGFYFTPALIGSRRFFAVGDLAPSFESQYGQTIWQWDDDQEKI
jgi:hypothetical protein